MKKEFKEEDIVSTTPQEHIRLRPQLYFKECFDAGNINALPFEMLCHAFDEYYDNNCSEISIHLQPDSFVIRYNAGLPLEKGSDQVTKAENILTALFACHNQKKHLAVGDEFCRVGLAIVNWATQRSEFTTVSKGERAIFRFEEGALISKEFSSTEEQDHTRIAAHFDRAIFPGLTFEMNGIHEKIAAIRQHFQGLKLEVTGY